MDIFTVEVREKGGTGPARAARRNKQVPGVLYGGQKDPVKIQMPLNQVMKAYQSGNMQTQLAMLSYKGEDQKILPREIQLHPLSGMPLHVDFLRVTDKTIINVEITVNFLNAETCPGIKRGGTLNIVRHLVEVNVPAGSIPEYFEVDLADLDIGGSAHISSIELPKGCTPVISDRDFTIATIAAPSGASESEEEEIDADEDSAEAVEGDENQEETKEEE